MTATNSLSMHLPRRKPQMRRCQGRRRLMMRRKAGVTARLFRTGSDCRLMPVRKMSVSGELARLMPRKQRLCYRTAGSLRTIVECWLPHPVASHPKSQMHGEVVKAPVCSSTCSSEPQRPAHEARELGPLVPPTGVLGRGRPCQSVVMNQLSKSPQRL